MLEEIETEMWEGDNLRIEGSKFGQSHMIMEDLDDYVVFGREFMDREYWKGRVLCNNVDIYLMETPRGDLSFHLFVAFTYIKNTPKEDLEQIRNIFRKYDLEKKKK